MPLLIYTVYRSPKDYPGEYVVRRWTISQDGQPSPERQLFTRGPSVELIRKELKAIGLHYIGRLENDDPVILESWI